MIEIGIEKIVPRGIQFTDTEDSVTYFPFESGSSCELKRVKKLNR